jgi:hypothetical protein
MKVWEEWVSECWDFVKRISILSGFQPIILSEKTTQDIIFQSEYVDFSIFKYSDIL